MKGIVFSSIISFFWCVSCSSVKKENAIGILEGKNGIADSSISLLNNQDTLIKPFVDTSYTFHINYNSQETEAILNAKVTFCREDKIIFSDSIHCDFLEIERIDIDSDGSKDILIFHSNEGGRANPTYYLFLVNPTNFTIKRVSGFEDLPNPAMDGNIITSAALAGTSTVYNFFRIKKNRLINLNNSVEIRLGDTLKYESVIKKLQNYPRYP